MFFTLAREQFIIPFPETLQYYETTLVFNSFVIYFEKVSLPYSVALFFQIKGSKRQICFRKIISGTNCAKDKDSHLFSRNMELILNLEMGRQCFVYQTKFYEVEHFLIIIFHIYEINKKFSCSKLFCSSNFLKYMHSLWKNGFFLLFYKMNF